MAKDDDKKQQQAEKGMFGLENIMKSFYNYQPDSDDEYGNYMKNTFASNMIQSAFDTQNAKDLAYTQAEISSAQMTQAADLQRLNTQAIMRKEYQYGTDMMKQQFGYQSEFADDQHSRDLGMMSAMGRQERKTAKQQQKSNERIASGRYDADKYVSDNQLSGTQYTADKQLAGVRDTNKANVNIANIQAGATRYTADQQLKGVDLTSGRQLEGVKDTNQSNIKQTDMTSSRQLEGTKFSATASKEAQLGVADKQLSGVKYSSDKNLEGTKYSSDKALEGTKYSSDKTLEGIKDTNVTSTRNIRATGDETRKTADNQQRLTAKDRANMHGYARRTARAY